MIDFNSQFEGRSILMRAWQLEQGQLLTRGPQSGSRGGGMLMFRILVFYSVWNPSPWMELPTFGEVLHPEVSSLNHIHRLAQSCLNPVKLTVKINLFFFI